jgi:hypothetical protein
MLFSRIGYGWQKRGYIYVLVGKYSGFYHALTNQLLGGGWIRVGALWQWRACWNLNVRGLVESRTACQSLDSVRVAAFFIQE